MGVFLPARHAARLCHGRILLLEAVAQSLRALHVLVYASHDAALFARGERLALEAVDAVLEAVLDEIRVHLGRVSPIRERRFGVHTFINSFICFFSMRVCNSRCSVAVSLDAVSLRSGVCGCGLRIHVVGWNMCKNQTILEKPSSVRTGNMTLVVGSWVLKELPARISEASLDYLAVRPRTFLTTPRQHPP